MGSHTWDFLVYQVAVAMRKLLLIINKSVRAYPFCISLVSSITPFVLYFHYISKTRFRAIEGVSSHRRALEPIEPIAAIDLHSTGQNKGPL